MKEWQPIETAPKDGSIIRVRGHGDWESTATWCNSWCQPLFSVGGRMPGGISLNDDHQPTHWRDQTDADWKSDREKDDLDRAIAFQAMGDGRLK